ncbi:MAG: hypothetical protein ACXWYT_03365 [Actinomycetota bacterium]
MDVRPPENEPSLRPGDILLFHGHGFVSWAIRRFDESDVDRAAIVLRPETMAEATASGLRHVAIEPAVDGNAFTYVRRLTAGVDTLSVAEQALAFSTDLPPTNDRTVLLAVLAMTRRLPIGEPALRRLLCVLLDHAAGIVDRLRVRGRSLLFGSEFVYRCFERTNDPRTMIEVGLASGAGSGPDSLLSAGATKAEAMLWEWASHIPDPKWRTARRPKEPLEPLIAAFARVDSPNDPIVPRSYVADAAIVEPSRPVDDGQLLAASVRFRDAMLRSGRGTGSTADPLAGDPWHLFREVASFVTPGDLRYSHSLQTVTSLRPSIHEGRGLVKRETWAESSDR